MVRIALERSAADFLPPRLALPLLRKAAARCRGCDLYKNATQTVCGEGAKTAQRMFVGEQPGDEEDRAGKPFVGPGPAARFGSRRGENRPQARLCHQCRQTLQMEAW